MKEDLTFQRVRIRVGIWGIKKRQKQELDEAGFHGCAHQNVFQ